MKKKNSDRGLIFLHFFRLTCHWNVYCYLWCRWEKLLPVVSFFLPLVLLPLVQFSGQRQEFLPMVHSCLWCCNTGHPPSLIRVFAVYMKKASVLSYALSAQRRLWSDWADGQAYLSCRGVHSHFVGFVVRRLIWFFFLFSAMLDKQHSLLKG